ncbi:site-specific integrase [Rubidibacter lacunae]|uniref:hypothetical protein n=1 Tax=Rubidibacter lacunae TaxID=582514 RepID=UPI0003FCE626|nr:hypothetical protein [Rubidibacter lacunae]
MLDGAIGAKTGARTVWALYPEWVERFNLPAIAITKLRGQIETADDYSRRGAKGFARYGVPHKPYAIRHCYSRRLRDFDVGDADAAAMMGHSLKVH